MKLKEYISKLNRFAKDHPGSKEWEVVYSADEEGNAFGRVYFDPTPGNFSQGDFLDEGVIEEMTKEGDAEPGQYPLNAICIN